MMARLSLLLTLFIPFLGLLILPIDLSALIMRLLAIGLIAFYIVPKQIIALSSNPRDWLTALRWQLLFSFVLVLLASVPTIVVQYLRTMGVIVPEILTETAKITGNFSFLIFAILWALIFHYRDKR